MKTFQLQKKHKNTQDKESPSDFFRPKFEENKEEAIALNEEKKRKTHTNVPPLSDEVCILAFLISGTQKIQNHA